MAYNQQTTPGGSFVEAEVITPAAAPLVKRYEALYVGTQGDVVVHLVNGGTVTFVGVVGMLWVANHGVSNASGASNIVGLK